MTKNLVLEDCNYRHEEKRATKICEKPTVKSLTLINSYVLNMKGLFELINA
jgi:hypothetical protein